MLLPLVTVMYVRVKEHLHMDIFHMYTLLVACVCETYMVAIVPVLINFNHCRLSSHVWIPSLVCISTSAGS